MTNRREFLTTVAVGAGLVRSRRPIVSAQPTVFHRHPDGQTTLVRFAVTDTDVPAGRLRVFDRANRLIGTAGLLRRGDLLVGDLWLPLSRETRIRSELEMPGTRRPIRTRHTLTPSARWTVHWLTAVHPERIRARLAPLTVFERAAAAAVLQQSAVRADPVAAAVEAVDHVDVLRTALPAAQVEREFGIPMSRVAVTDHVAAGSPLARALADTGVDGIVSAPNALVVDEVDPGRLVAVLETWLARLDASIAAVTVVLSHRLDQVSTIRAVIEAWNQRYAYPHIVLGEPPLTVAPLRSVTSASADSSASVTESIDAQRDRIVRRLRQRAARARERFVPLARIAAPSDPTLERLAQAFAFPVAGTLVFNSAPFGRSDRVVMPDGGERVVTDVPGLGYAFIPEPTHPASGPERTPGGSGTLHGARLEVTLDSTSGALTTLRPESAGASLLAPHGGNAIEGSRIVSTARERIPGVGSRLITQRRTRTGAVTTTVTAYEALPWIDIENTHADADPFTCTFRFAEPVRELAWDVPGGMERRVEPGAFAPLSWVSVTLSNGTLLFGVPACGRAELGADGALAFSAPTGRLGIRIDYRGFVLRDDAWRLGWSTVPMMALPTPGTGRLEIPTFGRMIEARDPGAAIVHVKPADDGIGSIVYLQDLLGIPRPVPIAPGVLRFSRAFATDYTERDRRPLMLDGEGRVEVPLEAFGFSAVRLLGISFAG